MKSVRPIAWLILAVCAIGVSLIWILPEVFTSNVVEKESFTELGPEKDFMIEVDWGDIPAGIAFRAVKSDWEVHARGERSIVVYDFKAEAMSQAEVLESLQMDLILVDEQGTTLREENIDTVFHHQKAKDIISLHWRLQDTLSEIIDPSKIRVRSIRTNYSSGLAEVALKPKIEPKWAGVKPEHVDFSFESRSLSHIPAEMSDSNLVTFAFATQNHGDVPIEYLMVNVEGFDEQGNSLFVWDKIVVDDSDAPMQARSTRLSHVHATEPPEFDTEPLAYVRLTILEADY